ncbi:MAG TPA: hypothetical protein PK325_18390 [Cyclobacteriaceae bacterium]|nr:hypothetical protein [Cyclobacteriaceae bacterium]HMV09483.1 hypothetical protein [Cyclobacteriaceae bacterium]HMV90087.1 hypothetical protein [Cyclobacteriaceae bacterium]HMX02684.1 hypothetical protein [Cyclobacteriaceae bacterium]HMX51593.1 hypothetical protein [Cyclobacteriaceae bacterium]
MYAFRKNIAVFLITGLGVLGLLNVSVQFGRIIDFFPGISMSLLLAEELVETEDCEKGNETFMTVDLILSKEAYVVQALVINHAVEVYLHSVDIPVHPACEKATPPPKA